MSEWISTKTRLPKPEEFPIWVWRKGWGPAKRLGQLDGPDDPSLLIATHWQPAKVPDPPKEETQEERDEAAYQAWMGPYREDCGSQQWHAALAWERERTAGEEKELRKNVKNILRSYDKGLMKATTAMGYISRLAGLEDQP